MKRFLIPFLSISLISGYLLICLVRHNSPFTSSGEISLKILTLFCVFIFIEVWALGSILLYFLRTALGKSKDYRQSFRICLRQAVWLAFLVIGFFIFQMTGLVSIINLILLMGVLVLLELYFGSRHKKEPDNTDRV
jgi:hypothetical protein